MKTMNFDVNSWEARLLLEACRVLHARWLTAARITADEGEQADYSNDLGQLEIVHKRLEEAASKTFGVTEYSRTPIP